MTDRHLFQVTEYKTLTPSKYKHSATDSRSPQNIIEESRFYKDLNLSNISTPIKLTLDSSSESFCSAASVSFDKTLDDTVKIPEPTMAEARITSLEQKLLEVTELLKASNVSSKQTPEAKIPLPKYFESEKDLTFKNNAIACLPSKFVGDDKKSAITHLREFDQWCLISGNCSDNVKIKWFAFTLAEKASTWFEVTEFYSYSHLKGLFETKFGDFRSNLEARIAFNEICLKTNERATDYHERITTLAQKAEMSDKDIADQFFRGLGNKYNSVKQTRCLHTLEQSITYLQSVLDYTTETPNVSFAVKENRHSERRSRSKTRNPSKTRNGSKHRSSSKSNGRSTSRSRSKSNSHNKNRSSTPYHIICHNCDGKGHIAKACPSPRRSNSRSNSKNRSSSKSNHYYSIKTEEDENNSSCASTPSEKPSGPILYQKMVDSEGKTVMIAVNDRNVNLN